MLSFRITVDKFPAFEAYAQLNNGKVVTVFQRNPAGNSVWSLFDLGVGIGQVIKGSVKL